MLSPLLFIIALLALYTEIRSQCTENLFYPDQMALFSETLEGMKGELESKVSKREG